MLALFFFISIIVMSTLSAHPSFSNEYEKTKVSLEQKILAMESSHASMQTCLESLKSQVSEQSDTINDMRKKLMTQGSKLVTQAERIQELESSNILQKKKTLSLEKEFEDMAVKFPQVLLKNIESDQLRQPLNVTTSSKDSQGMFPGFTAVMSAYVHSPAVGRRLTFPDVRFLSGSGFDSLTGVFNCPISGLYVFEHSLFVSLRHYIVTSIRKNGDVVVWIQGAGGYVDYYATGSGSTVVSLQVGDRVWIQVDEVSNDAVYGGHFTSFVGYLLKAN